MDRILRQQIVQVVQNCMTSINERYVTAETLCEHIETLTPEWLRKNGSCFNRTRVEWVDKEGKRHDKGSWLYPLNEIMQLMKDGGIKDLVVK